MKETKMKLFKCFSTSVFLGCVALGTLGLLTPGLTLAEGKGASKLMAQGPAQPQVQVAPAKSISMACPRCTDGYTPVANTAPKGMSMESTKLVAIHMCPSCKTVISVAGSGKAKTEKVDDSCRMGTSCCVAAK